MPRKQSEEAKIMHYFETAPMDSAKLLFNLVQGKMKQRIVAMSPAGQPKKARQSKVNGTSASVGTMTVPHSTDGAVSSEKPFGG